MTDPSFYYAIYKRLQATASSHGAHINGDNDPPDQIYGGFSLKYADATYGIFKQLAPAGDVSGATRQSMKPLKDNDTTPANNPMWAILNASLVRRILPDKMHRWAARQWPVMPPPLQGETIAQTYPEWMEFNPDGQACA